MTTIEAIILFVSAFFAGIANSIAGGGSFLTFPALVFAGVPIIAANATSAVAVFPGYLSGALGFMKELKTYPKGQFSLLIFISALGGVLGSLLLLKTPTTLFSFVIPWLLGFATVMFAFGNLISKWAKNTAEKTSIKGNLATLFVCIYGGYFNGGFLLIVFMMLFTYINISKK